MDGTQFVDAVRDDRRTELERLGSDKALLAATGADLETDVVLGVVASRERALATTLETWAEGTAAGAVTAAFEDAAATARDHADRLAAARVGDQDWEGDGPDLHLGDPEGPVERVAAALVGQSLVLDRTLLQGVNFFVNEADETRADLLREVREGVADRLATGAAVLDGQCDAEEWERARAAAGAVVDGAYGTYAETLTGMGLDPKPVC